MAFDSSLSPLLTPINIADTPSYELESTSNVIGSSTYNTDVVWGGPGGTFQIITTGNLASLAQVATRGLLAIKTVGSGLVSALITEGTGINVTESGNDFLVSVVPNTTNQLVTGQCNGASASSPKNKINFVAGSNVSLSLLESSDALNWTINSSGDSSEWAEYPAISNVDMDGWGISNLDSFQLTDDPVAGYVLVSDDEGYGTWQPAALPATTTTVSTTDATPTTLATIAVPTGNAITISGIVVARNTTSTINNATGGRFTATAINTAGTVTLAGPTDVLVSATSTGTFDVIVSGTNLVVQVTGIAATAYNWSVSYSKSTL